MHFSIIFVCNAQFFMIFYIFAQMKFFRFFYYFVLIAISPALQNLPDHFDLKVFSLCSLNDFFVQNSRKFFRMY